MAGILGAAIAGALSGGGRAVQWNAQSAIQQKRDAALKQLDHDLAMQRQDDSQQFTAQENQADRTFRRDERVAGQEFTSGENQLNRQHDTALVNIRESGADRRSNAQITASREAKSNDWQLVPLEGGGYAQYSPTRNEYRDANLPEGAKMTATSDLTERQKYQLDGIADRMKAIRKSASDVGRELTTEEKAEMGRLQGQYQSILGGGGGQTMLEKLLAGEGGTQAVSGDQAGNAATAQPDSVPGIIQRQRQAQQATQEANEAKREANDTRNAADAILDRIEKEKGGGAEGWLSRSVNQARGQGGVSDETLAEAQRVAEQLLALDQNPNLSADQKRWIAERIMQLQDAGVPININQ
ncbi:hypothetical protein DFO67_108135 [Modicisalibacter xianhensis]|uniref:Uncharacterized protein n=1 Tax=Modicisalibacter xianhensis TaxID=442341 RepID=A0A4R8FR96_9GAMM|nr:hypothetical protein [Halomonas xianhensis]TDX29091.1 hypothetical protein DFO67_108135 [Halomonas xianhensis]